MNLWQKIQGRTLKILVEMSPGLSSKYCKTLLSDARIFIHIEDSDLIVFVACDLPASLFSRVLRHQQAKRTIREVTRERIKNGEFFKSEKAVSSLRELAQRGNWKSGLRENHALVGNDDLVAFSWDEDLSETIVLAANSPTRY